MYSSLECNIFAFLFLAWRWGWSHIDCKHMMKTYTWDFYAAKAAKRFELCFSFSIPHLGRMGRSCWSTVPSPVTTSELSGAATPTRVGLHLVYQCISPVILCNFDNTPNHFGDIFLYIHTHTHIYIYIIHIHIYPITPHISGYIYIYIYTPQNPMIYRHTPSIQWPLSSYPVFSDTSIWGLPQKII